MHLHEHVGPLKDMNKIKLRCTYASGNKILPVKTVCQKKLLHGHLCDQYLENKKENILPVHLQ